MTALDVSINRVLMGAEGDKVYVQAHPDDYEWGCARRGRYAAHAHRAFTDVLFAPGGVSKGSGPDLVPLASLLWVDPGTWFGPVEIEDFFFLKFQGTRGPMPDPDKVTDQEAMELGQRTCMLLGGEGTVVEASIYLRSQNQMGMLRLEVRDRQFQLSIDDQEVLRVSA